MFYNRNTKEYNEVITSKYLKFLYNTFLGRIILKIFTSKFSNNVIGLYMSSPLSKRKIKKFIKVNHIDMSEYVESNYNSFDDFFVREIKEGKRFFNPDENILLAPCDSKLLVYKIDENSCFNIKNSKYTIKELLQDNELADQYMNGYCLVFRLSVDDYHHYSFIDNGNLVKQKKIKGIFHTVQPISFKKYKVFHENYREYSLLNTEHFGKIVQMEVGALGVGKVCNRKVSSFKRGEEKGYFRFGGSTVIVLIQDNKVVIDKDIIDNSLKDIETRVKLYESIGRKM